MRSYAHLRVFRTFGQFRKTEPKYLKLWERTQKDNPKSLAWYFTSNEVLCFKIIWGSSAVGYLGNLGNLGSLCKCNAFEGRVIPVLVYLGIRASWRNCNQKPQMKGTDSQKVIQNVKLHISRQIKPYKGQLRV